MNLTAQYSDLSLENKDSVQFIKRKVYPYLYDALRLDWRNGEFQQCTKFDVEILIASFKTFNDTVTASGNIEYKNLYDLRNGFYHSTKDDVFLSRNPSTHSLINFYHDSLCEIERYFLMSSLSEKVNLPSSCQPCTATILDLRNCGLGDKSICFQCFHPVKTHRNIPLLECEGATCPCCDQN
jgi:hypothetical protein